MSVMVILYKRVCVSAGCYAHAPTKWMWYLGGAKIELCHHSFGVAQSGSCVQLLSRSAFGFITAVVVAQFRLSISEQVAKIHRHFAVHSCDLRPFCSCCMCCHALNRIDLSASGPLVPSSLRSECYIPGVM